MTSSALPDPFNTDELPDPTDDLDQEVAAEEQDEDPTRAGHDDTDEPGQGSRGARGSARKRANDKALVRRTATKVAELTAADPDDRAMLAGILAVEDDPVEVTVAVLTAGRTALTAVHEVLDIAQTDDIERGIALMSMGRPRMRNLWQIYLKLGVTGIEGSIPASDTKAAMALARAHIDDTIRDRLDRVVQPAKRG